jgi:hypothetical protein
LTLEVNGDTLPDVVVLDAGTGGSVGGARVLLNQQGVLVPFGLVGSIVAPVEMQFADLDADGVLDLVVLGGASSTTVTTFRAVGPGSFAPMQTVGPLPGVPIDLDVGDVDDDGDVDVVFTTVGGVSVIVLSNDGSGLLAPPQVLVSSTRLIARCLVADINTAGAVDLLLGLDTPGGAMFVRGMGNGAFAPPVSLHYPIVTGLTTTSLAAIDVQANLLPDALMTMALPGQPGTFEMTHDVAFFPGSFRLIHRLDVDPAFLVTADLDGDERLDVVVGATPAWGGTLSVLRNLGRGWFARPAPLEGVVNCRGLTVADFDGDGSQDLLVMSPGSGLVMMRNLTPQGMPIRVGSGELELSLGVNGDPVPGLPGRDVLRVPSRGHLSVDVASFGGFLRQRALLLGVEVGATSVVLQGFPEVHVGGPGFSFLVDGSIPNGVGQPSEVVTQLGSRYSYAVPFAPGVRVIVQAFALSPDTVNGVFAASDAYELIL